MQDKAHGKPARFAYSMAEAAEALGVSRPYVYTLLAEGKLQSFQLGRRRLIPANSLESLVERLTEVAA